MNNKYQSCFFLGLLVVFTISSKSGAKERSTFEDDSVLKTVNPYKFRLGPKNPAEKDRRHSGYVEFTFMVNEQGSAENISIVFASHHRFEANALAALKQYEFNPAILNGDAVASKSRIRVFFNADKSPLHYIPGRSERSAMFNNSSDIFFELHKTFQELASEGKPDLARMAQLIVAMGRLDTVDTIAQTLLSIDRYYLKKLSDKALGQARDIKSALYYNSQIPLKYYQLKSEQHTYLEASLQSVLLETNRLAEAKKNWFRLENEHPDIAAQYVSAIMKIDTAESQKKPYGRLVSLNDRGISFQALLHRGFELHDIEGKVDKLAIRCETKFFEANYETDSYFSLPKKWGECEVEIIGAPNTKLLFVEA